MTDLSLSRIQPPRPVPAVAGVRPVLADEPRQPALASAHAERQPQAGASTGGSLRPAYGEFAVDPETHEVVLRIRDARTDHVLQQVSSADLQAMARELDQYASVLARRQAAAHHPTTGAD